MDSTGWPRNDATRMAAELERLGLERNVYELEVHGLTVVDAARTGAVELTDRAFARICDLLEERTGTRPDVEGGTTHVDVFTPSLYHVIFEDRVFEQLLTHPMALALSTWLLGPRCVLSGTEVFMKGPATVGAVGNGLGLGADSVGLQLGLHSDNAAFPPPYPYFSQICNVTWLLSDYTRAGGALAFVPGSHRMCRNPAGDEGSDQVVAVEAPRGSLVVWHGNTWHGSFPRTEPGLRTGLAFALVRDYVRPHEPDRSALTQEMLDRNPPAFARLMGADAMEWGPEGPNYARLVQQFRRSITS